MPQYNSKEIQGDFVVLEKPQSVEIFEGEIGCMSTSTGQAAVATISTSIKALGRVDKVDDNQVLIRRSVFSYDNDAADPISKADIGNVCYIKDSHTVSKTSASNTKAAAGKVYDVAEGYVWVDFK